MTTRISSAGLALLVSFLIALPSAAFADDTELFTTSANPNVLLMLDTTGSMHDTASGTSVGDLDGEDGSSNTRMDILWKVIYTLLNADLSTPDSTVSASGTLGGARTTSGSWDTNGRCISAGSTTYNRIRLANFSSTEWNAMADSGTVVLGSGPVQEALVYTSKGYSSSGGYYYLNFNSRTFVNDWYVGNQISYSYSGTYSNNFPTNHTEAMSADFLNNLTTADDNTLLARLGLMTFTTNSSGSAVQINIRNQILSTAPNSPPFTPSYQNIWYSVTQYAYASGGTPTAQALRGAQTFFNTAYNSSQVCRPNFAVMVTDGEDTMGGSPSGGSGNGYGPDYYNSGSFYPNGYSVNVGQVARHNAVIQEAANLLSNNPTVKLFTVGVGISDTAADKNVQREVLRRAAEQTNAQANNAEYTAIGASGDNTSRGAGRAFFATDAESLSSALRIAFHQMSLGTYSFTAPTVASVRMTDRNYVYKASFAPAAPPATFWNGSLQAGTINADNTISWLWDADNVLKGTGVSSRRIYSGAPSGGTWGRLDFGTNPSGATSPQAVDNNMLNVSGGTGTGSLFDNVVKYVRGTGHDNNAKLGDIFHSKPVVVGPPSPFYFDEGYSTGGVNSFVNLKAQRKRVVYLGTNDGMLHAFLSGTYLSGSYDAGTGEELFGYVPYNLLENLEDFLPADLTKHGYYVDSSPRVADVWIDTDSNGTKASSEWRTVLISGFRKGGYGYFALDVTDPPAGTDYTNFPKVLWEYTDGVNLGESWSEPFIGKVKVTDGSTVRDRWVAIFGGGVGTGNVGSSLVVLDIATGHALKTFTSTDGINNVIPASPTAVLDANGYIKFVYVADLTGSVYKFNFWNAATVSSFSVSPISPPTVTGTQWTVNRIFQPASGGQPVYHRVEPGALSETSRYLFFGTGNQESPISDGGTGKFYAIMDTDSSTSLIQESVSGTLANLTGNLGTGTASPTVNGWYVNLAGIVNSDANTVDTNTHTMEKVLSDPVVFFNNVYFTTFTPNPSDPCSGGGIARVYGINMYNATAGLASYAGYGLKPSDSKVGYYVYSGNPEGGIPSSPSLSIYPSGQSSIFIGFSTGAIKEIKIDSPLHMKNIKSWKEIF
jgi:type IV pilus assembly protein PilY1